MFTPIHDYALLSNLRCAALVSQAGSIDWFCPGRFDAPACFTAILGHEKHGRWVISPSEKPLKVERHYPPDTLVLETIFTTSQGRVKLVDAMPISEDCHILRSVQALEGRVRMQMRCDPRFQFGKDLPEVHQANPNQIRFVPPDGGEGHSYLQLQALGMAMHLVNTSAHGEFCLNPGERVAFALSHAPAADPWPDIAEVEAAFANCASWWRQWISCCQYTGRWETLVKRSLITLKAMTYHPSGGMVAAVTMSLPEVPGGKANYDYRFCWLRDAAFAVKVLINEGYRREAHAWLEWLLKAVSQHDEHLHALYTIDAKVAGEEGELEWLPGYLNSRPVRCGNAASHQYQLDVRGELMEVFHLARSYGMDLRAEIWALQCEILERMGERWRQPDTGIWEFRTIKDHLTHSKVLAWVAYDRCIRDAERFGFSAPLDHWRREREAIRQDVLQHGVDPEGGYFTQRYGHKEVDASLLMIPLVGFLPADDPRMTATIAAIERDLCEDGLVRRYRTGDQANVEGLFLACCFWLVDNYWLAGRKKAAEALFKRLIGLCNDVGLLAEEYDPKQQQMLGNFPQGLSHLALISSARLIATSSDEDVSLT